MNKVWVLQENVHLDYAPAAEWGDVEFITRHDVSPFKRSQQAEGFESDMKKFISKYIPGTDYIILTGNPVAIVKLGMDIPRGEHKFLKWDVRRNQYHEVGVTK